MSRRISMDLLRTMLREWKWIFGYIKKYRLTVLLYILFGVFSSVMGVGGTVAGKYLIDAVITKDNSTLMRSAAAVITLLILNVLFQALISRISAILSTRVDNELRNEIYGHVVKAQWEKIGSFHSGELLNRLEGDVSAVASGVIGFIPGAFTKLLTFALSFIVVLYYDKVMAFLALLSAPFFVLSSRFLVKTIRRYHQESREMNGKVLSFSEESLRNLQTIKAFDLISQYIRIFREVTETYREVRLRYEKFNILMTMVLSLLGIVVSYACYGWAVYRLWQGLITVGTMTLFLQISGTLTSSFSSLASLAPRVVSIATSAGRIMEIADYETETDADRETAGRLLAQKEKGVSLRVKDLSFQYANTDRRVLNDVSIEIRQGELVGIIGRSGNGKTTFLKLLLGLLNPVSGSAEILVGEESIRISDSTRRFFAYVPQETAVFTGTIADNLRLAAPEATDAALHEALRLACLDDFIAAQPEGLDFAVEENGENLSHGQLQRLLIARAALRDAPIMLFDEATSALDAETEARVMANLMQSAPDKIFILTTHRESILAHCTRIYAVTENGRLIPYTGENEKETEEETE